MEDHMCDKVRANQSTFLKMDLVLYNCSFFRQEKYNSQMTVGKNWDDKVIHFLYWLFKLFHVNRPTVSNFNELKGPGEDTGGYLFIYYFV